MTRGDDAGSCRSANLAVLEAAQKGILRNVSVMVPGPAFQEAARMLAGRQDICVGLHVTLTAEWDSPKWGPVLPPEKAPSLVDSEGRFFNTPMILHQRKASADEMMAEIQAQLDLARSCGMEVMGHLRGVVRQASRLSGRRPGANSTGETPVVPVTDPLRMEISYIDEHMGVGWVGGLQERISELARREGLVDSRLAVAGLPRVEGHFEDRGTELIARLAAAPPGTYLYVTHPGCDAADMRQFIHAGLKPGQVARERDADRRIWFDPKVVDYCRRNGFRAIRYTEISSGPAPAPGGSPRA